MCALALPTPGKGRAKAQSPPTAHRNCTSARERRQNAISWVKSVSKFMLHAEVTRLLTQPLGVVDKGEQPKNNFSFLILVDSSTKTFKRWLDLQEWKFSSPEGPERFYVRASLQYFWGRGATKPTNGSLLRDRYTF